MNYWRGFLIFNKSVLKSNDNKNNFLEKLDHYEIDFSEPFYIIKNKKSGTIYPADFFKLPYLSKKIHFVYGYITEPILLDFKNVNDVCLFNEYFQKNRNLNYFENKSNELNGSFTLVTLCQEGKIEIFTDRLGTRPIYYTSIYGTWVISSSGGMLLDFLKELDYPVKPNLIAFTSLLLRGRPINEMTMVSGVLRSGPGEIINLLNNEKKIVKKWFKFRFEPKLKFENDSSKIEIIEKVIDNCAFRVAQLSNKPLLFLSGGIDSRLVCVLLKDKLKDLLAVTLCDRINNEARIARQVADCLKIKHSFYFRSKEYYKLNLENYIRNCLGGYYYVHAHFSGALNDIEDRSEIYLGDFLESLKKLIGYNEKLIENIKRPYDIINNLFLLDGYSTKLGFDALKIFKKDVRNEVYDKFKNLLLEIANEAFDVSTDIPIIVDYFLRWRRADEISTFGMFEDIRLFRSDRNIAWDNEFINLLLSLSADDRKSNYIPVIILKKRHKDLAIKIPNANTLVPPGCPKMLTNMIIKMRKDVAKLRRSILTIAKRPPLTGMHSWQNTDYLNVTDENWKDYIEEKIFSDIIFSNNEFDHEFVKEAWRKYLKFDFRYNYIIYSLLNYSIIFES